METPEPAVPLSQTPAAPAEQTPAPGAGVEDRPQTSDLVRIHLRVETPPGVRVRVDVEAVGPDQTLLDSQSVLLGGNGAAGPVIAQRVVKIPRAAWPPSWFAHLRGVPWAITLPTLLMALALAFYAFTRLYALPSFPIYFFTDEAIQTVSAADLLRDHLYSPTKELLPTYFENGSQYNLSASVYLQIIPYILFGKSIWVTRGVAALMTLIAAFSVGQILRRSFQNPYPWLAVMVLSTTPVWFLHSRTAFETGLAASFFALFLLTYMIYRLENPRYIFAAVAAGALVFYSYAPMRVVILAAGLLLLVVDARYHWQNRKLVGLGFGLTLLLALPFIRFLINHPTESEWQMRMLGSYWLKNIPLGEKLRLYGLEYLRGLNPAYWYLPTQEDLPRHIMLGYGHLLRQTLPFGLLGVGLALYHARRSPAYRTILIGVLVVPTGAALVHIGATRLLAMVIPMAILTALALATIMEWLNRRFHVSRAVLGLVVFVPLAFLNLFMLRDALVNGPFWYNDYGLGGMQYGGRQLFTEIKKYLRDHPNERLVVSPSWANGTDVIARFFFNDPLPFQMGTAKGYYLEGQAFDEQNTVFVMIPEEYKNLPKERFQEIKVMQTLPYPDGQPGFYFVRLRYVDNIGEVVAAEKEARRKLIFEDLQINGETVHVGLPPLDIGEPKNLFDGDPNSLGRSAGVNPMQILVQFPSVRQVNGVKLRIGGAASLLTITVWQEGQASPLVFTQPVPEAPDIRDVTVDLKASIATRKVQIDVMNALDNVEGFVHVWEVTFQ